MPNVKAIHWNPPENTHPEQIGKTRCGQDLAVRVWRHDIKDVTCNTCLRLVARFDGAK